MIFIKCALIAFSVAYIVDLSGVVGKLNRQAFRWLYGSKIEYNGWYIPLFGCSRCLTFWGVLIFCIMNIPFVFALATACFFSFVAPMITDALKWITRKALDGMNK